jgi:hypothetical protein
MAPYFEGEQSLNTLSPVEIALRVRRAIWGGKLFREELPTSLLAVQFMEESPPVHSWSHGASLANPAQAYGSRIFGKASSD